MTQPTHREPPLARLVGRRPNRGAADAAKEVVADIQTLLRAEIALAKAEVADGVKAKLLGAGFFIVAAVIGWLAIQVFLVFLGFLFALFLPGWAAVGLVLLLLLIAMGLVGYMGLRKLKADASLTTTKASVEESKRATSAAIDHAKANTRDGIEEARSTVAAAVDELKGRLQERRPAGGAAVTTGPTDITPRSTALPPPPAGRAIPPRTPSPEEPAP